MNWLLIICFSNSILVPVTGMSQETNPIAFEIEDQFKREYTEKSWQDSVLIILGSDQEGSQYNPLWVNAIYDSLQMILPELPVRQVGLADLSGAPFFVTGIVRGMFPDDPQQWVLMDWDGIFSDTYDFVEEESNIPIFDPRGVLVYQTSGKEPGKIKMSEIVETLRKLSD